MFRSITLASVFADATRTAQRHDARRHGDAPGTARPRAATAPLAAMVRGYLAWLAAPVARRQWS